MTRRRLSDLLKIIFAVSLFSLAIFITFKVRMVEIVGLSMCPTLGHGDRCMLYITQDVERGDIITIDMGNGKSYCKRVVGVEGDELYVMKYGTLINGYLEPERYVLFYDLHTPKMKVKVKKGELWVMGDNRHCSNDSRHFGPIKRSQVEGKLLWILGRKL